MRDHTQQIGVQEAYFNWLYYPFYEGGDPSSWYRTVCELMHETIFRVLVRHDENRVADAAEFRNRFQHENQLEPLDSANLLTRDASVFEVLLALAKRADFMVPLTEKVWFIIFLENLRIDKYTDDYCSDHSVWPVRRAINMFNNRSYASSGRGGIFPLRHPHHDQREIELWYQMGAYMTENAMY